MNTSQQQSVIYSVLAATIICTFFIGFDYLQAQWSGAPGTPPSDNIAAPIHTGGGVQSKGNGSDPDNRIGTGMFTAGVEVRSDRYCDANGNNCYGPEGSSLLNSNGQRFYYQRIGGSVGQTAEHVPYPTANQGGGDWDFCMISGNRRLRADAIHPSDYDVSPTEFVNGHTKHPTTSYRSYEAGAQCSIFRGGGNMSDFEGNPLPGNRWTILLSETNTDVVARCIATCYKRNISN